MQIKKFHVNCNDISFNEWLSIQFYLHCNIIKFSKQNIKKNSVLWMGKISTQIIAHFMSSKSFKCTWKLKPWRNEYTTTIAQVSRTLIKIIIMCLFNAFADLIYKLQKIKKQEINDSEIFAFYFQCKLSSFIFQLAFMGGVVHCNGAIYKLMCLSFYLNIFSC